MSHTPGPWYVSYKPDADEAGLTGEDVYCQDGGVFAVVDEETETIAQPQNEDDARLIAAAPDLLEALANLVAACGLRQFEDNGDSDDDAPFLRICVAPQNLKFAIAAIRKADRKYDAVCAKQSPEAWRNSLASYVSRMITRKYANRAQPDTAQRREEA